MKIAAVTYFTGNALAFVDPADKHLDFGSGESHYKFFGSLERE